MRDELSGRERQVAELTAQGLTCAEAGEVLGLSGRTVEVYRAHAMIKLKARNAAHLAALLNMETLAALTARIDNLERQVDQLMVRITKQEA
ncbi:helix-turn-helix transcriptional regulator [Devosia sp. 1635]|uniref:LuxR C-terminal-related transcriptional regulator n=1 Tax=Devosia sp. 1635 TaxID=2726066 RepID=UPI00156431E2|nr:helix-turn-helix transcriptional regulator [Devosia sp. 1635]